jgi:hypothetical protein
LRFKERRFSIADQQKRRFQTAAPWRGEAALVSASSDGALALHVLHLPDFLAL